MSTGNIMMNNGKFHVVFLSINHPSQVAAASIPIICPASPTNFMVLLFFLFVAMLKWLIVTGEMKTQRDTTMLDLKKTHREEMNSLLPESQVLMNQAARSVKKDNDTKKK